MKIKRKIIPASLVVFAVVALFYLTNGINSSDSVTELLLGECSGLEDSQGCYFRELYKKMKNLTFEEGVEAAAELSRLDPGSQNCHLLGHAISEGETAKDPEKWQEVFLNCPDTSVCGGVGCLHGAFLERVQTDPENASSYLDEIKSLCDSGAGRETVLKRKQCYHGMGHVIPYVTLYDHDRSVEICKELTPGDKEMRRECYDGLFMEIFNPPSPEEENPERLILGREELMVFCSKYDELAGAVCWSEAWPLAEEDITTREGIESYCSFLDGGRYSQECYGLLSIGAAQILKFGPIETVSFCGSFGEKKVREACVYSVSLKMMRDDNLYQKAVELCLNIKREEEKESCFQGIFRGLEENFGSGSPEPGRICRTLPVNWRDKCPI